MQVCRKNIGRKSHDTVPSTKYLHSYHRVELHYTQTYTIMQKINEDFTKNGKMLTCSAAALGLRMNATIFFSFCFSGRDFILDFLACQPCMQEFIYCCPRITSYDRNIPLFTTLFWKSYFWKFLYLHIVSLTSSKIYCEFRMALKGSVL